MYHGPQRKKLRLPSYDYNQDGYYFVTICTKNREHFFGEIVKGKIILSEMGNIVEQEIENNLRENILIDSYVIMPNHVHTIIIIQNTPTPVGCDCIAPEGTNAPEIKNFPGMNNIPGTNNAPLKNIQTHKIKTIKPDNKTLYPTNGTMQSFPTLSRVIRGMKGRITGRIQKESVDGYAFAWQKSFYDIIIRNEDQLHKTRQYICDNPKNWDKDSNNV